MPSRVSSTVRSIAFALLCCALGAVATSVRAELAATPAPAEGYRLGIFPYLSPRSIVELYGPVVNDMSKTLGVPVKLESAPSFSSFVEALSGRVYDIAFIQPFDYARAVDQLGYEPLARLSAPLITQFFVRDDSAYKTLQNLRGTLVTMPPALSANARMALRALQDNELVPGRDLDVRYLSSHDSCIQQVWIGAASACATARPPITVFEQRMNAKLRSVYDTPAIPHALFVANPRIPPAQRAALRDLMIGWRDTDTGRALLKGLAFPGFAAVVPGEYNILREYHATLSPAQAATETRAELVLGVFPYLPARQLAAQLAPLRSALAIAAGQPVQFRSAGSFGKFLDGVAGGRFDFILVQPFDYSTATKQGYRPLARTAGDIDAHIYVRADSSIQTVDDLRGKRIAMPPFEAAMSRLGRSGLRKAGINPGRDVTLVYTAAHDACLQQVQLNMAAACITARLTLQMVSKELTDNLRSIAELGAVPGAVFLAHSRVANDVQERVRSEMISWNGSKSGRRLLSLSHLGSFVAVDPADYEALPGAEDVR